MISQYTIHFRSIISTTGPANRRDNFFSYLLPNTGNGCSQTNLLHTKKTSLEHFHTGAGAKMGLFDSDRNISVPEYCHYSKGKISLLTYSGTYCTVYLQYTAGHQVREKSVMCEPGHLKSESKFITPSSTQLRIQIISLNLNPTGLNPNLVLNSSHLFF